MLDHFDLLAPFYDRLISSPETDRLQELLQLPVAGPLLDIGGGTGRVTAQLEPLIGRLVIADASFQMLQQAQEKGFRRPVLTVAERLPFADGAFERVLVVDALHHFFSQRQALAEMVRVLRPGGRLVVEEPDLNRPLVKAVAVAEKLMLMHSRFLYPHEIGRILAAQDLRPRILTDDRFAAWIVADKAG